MHLLVFNMSNLIDWQHGIVNRNYFILQKLIQSNKFEEIILVDFLAIQSSKKIFGKQRTYKYGKWFYSQSYSSLGGGIGVHKQSYKELFESEKEIHHIAGMGLFTTASKRLDQIQLYLGQINVDLNDTVIWNYNAFLPQVHELPAKLTVFDTVDNWAHHASYIKEAGLLTSNYEEIANTADLIFTVSEGLLNLFDHKNIHWIPNGVDFDLFSAIPYKQHTEKIKIGYIGTIQERVDFDLITKLCELHPKKEFHFYGPIWSGVQSLVDELAKKNKNLVFHGRVSYRELPLVLADIDITIIPHKLDDFLASTNPMKMYDYLAAGKPVVTTPGAGTQDFKDVLSIADSVEGFSQAINNAILEDSPEMMIKRRKRVKLHIWNERVKEMLEIIDRISE